MTYSTNPDPDFFVGTVYRPLEHTWQIWLKCNISHSATILRTVSVRPPHLEGQASETLGIAVSLESMEHLNEISDSELLFHSHVGLSKKLSCLSMPYLFWTCWHRSAIFTWTCKDENLTCFTPVCASKMKSRGISTAYRMLNRTWGSKTLPHTDMPLWEHAKQKVDKRQEWLIEHVDILGNDLNSHWTDIEVWDVLSV